MLPGVYLSITSPPPMPDLEVGRHRDSFMNSSTKTGHVIDAEVLPDRTIGGPRLRLHRYLHLRRRHQAAHPRGADAHRAPVGGVGPALDPPAPLQPPEDARHGGRMDAGAPSRGRPRRAATRAATPAACAVSITDAVLCWANTRSMATISGVCSVNHCSSPASTWSNR